MVWFILQDELFFLTIGPLWYYLFLKSEDRNVADKV